MLPHVPLLTNLSKQWMCSAFVTIYFFCISELVIIFWCHNCARIFLFYFSWVIMRYKLLFSEKVKWSLAYVWMLHGEASIYFFLNFILKPCSGSKLPSSPYLSLSPFFLHGKTCLCQTERSQGPTDTCKYINTTIRFNSYC